MRAARIFGSPGVTSRGGGVFLSRTVNTSLTDDKELAMKPTKSKKSTKTTQPAQTLSVDQLRAIVGGALNTKEECKK